MNSKHINYTAIQETQDRVFDFSQKIIDAMAIGERKTNQDWVNQVALETNTPISITNGLVSLFLKHCGEIKSRSGAFGGHFKIDPTKDKSADSQLDLSKAEAEVEDEAKAN